MPTTPTTTETTVRRRSRLLRGIAGITLGLAALAPSVAQASPTPPPDGFVDQVETDDPEWGPGNITNPTGGPCNPQEEHCEPKPDPCDLHPEDPRCDGDDGGDDEPEEHPEDDPEPEHPGSSVEDRPIRATPTFTG